MTHKPQSYKHLSTYLIFCAVNSLAAVADNSTDDCIEMTTPNLTDVMPWLSRDTKEDSTRVKIAVLDVSFAFFIPAVSPFLSPPQ